MNIEPLKGLSDSQGEGGHDSPLPEEEENNGKWGCWLAVCTVIFMVIAMTKAC